MVPQKLKRVALLCCLSLTVALSACGGAAPEEQPPEELPAEPEPVAEPVSAPEEYDDLIALFAEVCDGAEISTHKATRHIDITLTCANFSSETVPDNWTEIVSRLESALEQGHELAEQYGVLTVSGELVDGSETILASGINGKLGFDLFAQHTGTDGGKNPPTISRHEYDQITVGMTLSQVCDLIGGSGTLQSEYGTPGGVISNIQCYRWLGEAENSYADILFEDYVVYSKVQIFLE